MSRCLLAATVFGLLLPRVGISAQTRITGVLQGSLVLLPAPTGSADVSPSGGQHVASSPAAKAPPPEPRAGAVNLAGSMAFSAPWQSAARPGPRIRAVVSTGRLTVWAPAAQRIELRPAGDSIPDHTVECLLNAEDAAAPATCDTAGALPARATLTVYFLLDGSR